MSLSLIARLCTIGFVCAQLSCAEIIKCSLAHHRACVGISTRNTGSQALTEVLLFGRLTFLHKSDVFWEQRHELGRRALKSPIEIPSLLEPFEAELEQLPTTCLSEIDMAIRALLGMPGDVADTIFLSVMHPLGIQAEVDRLQQLVNPGFSLGTFMLGERRQQPMFLRPADRGTLRQWVYSKIDSEISGLLALSQKGDMDAQRFMDLLKVTEKEVGVSLRDQIYLFLFLRGSQGERFMDLIPSQIYQDVFLRLLSKLVVHHAHAYPYGNREFNERLEQVVMAMIPNLQINSIREMFQYSIAAGALGLDMKSNASLSSVIQHTNTIAYFHGPENDTQRAGRMLDQLRAMAERSLAIDFWPEFEAEFIRSREPKTLTFFHDDYAETIFDLLFIQMLLKANPLLTVVSIPRAGPAGYIRFGNDASWLDFQKHLRRPIFRDLFNENLRGRFRVISTGPTWGAVRVDQMSPEAIREVEKSSSILVKGARSYEMLQGLRKSAYFAFMVCREFSESITGIDADTGLSVFVHQKAGLPSFSGFRERHRRLIPLFGTGEKGWAAQMTTMEYSEAVRSESFYRILAKHGEDALQAADWIRAESDRRRMGIHMVILEKDWLTRRIWRRFRMKFHELKRAA